MKLRYASILFLGAAAALLTLIAQGQKNKEIAYRLGITEDTIDMQEHNIARDRLRRRRIAGGDPLIERMPLWQCPVHTIWGECDALYGDNLAKIPAVMSRCNHVGFHVIPDAGHWVQYERPEAFNEVALRCLGPV